MKEPKLTMDLNSMRVEEAETKITEVISMLSGKARGLDLADKNDVNELHAIRFYNTLLNDAINALKSIND